MRQYPGNAAKTITVGILTVFNIQLVLLRRFSNDTSITAKILSTKTSDFSPYLFFLEKKNSC